MINNRFDSFLCLLCFLLCFPIRTFTQERNPFDAKIIPIESSNPNDKISNKETQNLSSLFQSSRIIALGESTHGTHEIFAMKHRLIRFLIQSKGYRLIGLEAGMPETETVNRYILYGEGSAHAVVRQLGMWNVGNYDVLALVEWLRTYNKTQTNGNKVRLCGFDVQMTDSAAQIVMRFLQEVNPPLAEKISREENQYHWLLTNPTSAAKNMWVYLDDSTKKARIANADNIVRHLDQFSRHYLKVSSFNEYTWARRNAWLISRAVRLFAAIQSRDSCMAENVSWLMKFYKEKNIVLWAHNDHIWCEKNSVFNSISMGWYLRQSYKKDYFALSITANVGVYCGVVQNSGLRWDNKLSLIYPQCVENYLHQLQIPQGFINFRTIEEQNADYHWFTLRQIIRSIGAIASPKQFAYTYLLKNFDALIFIDSTTAATPLPDFYQMR